MRCCILLLLLFVSCHDSPPPDVIKIKIPEAKPSRMNLVVTISNENKVYIKNREVPLAHLDSLLKQAIDSTRDLPMDSATVLLQVDTAAHYGVVFKVLRTAKSLGAKVVASVAGN
ncbi:MAG TPA: biopolymer transporter ExbD [Chitinophagaceae bacterium]|nr:biopolymer transporter ExbD [Chitinophagaceae bacterium]